MTSTEAEDKEKMADAKAKKHQEQFVVCGIPEATNHGKPCQEKIEVWRHYLAKYDGKLLDTSPVFWIGWDKDVAVFKAREHGACGLCIARQTARALGSAFKYAPAPEPTLDSAGPAIDLPGSLPRSQLKAAPYIAPSGKMGRPPKAAKAAQAEEPK